MTRTVRFGIIGGGLMGREFASAAARWIHLDEMGARPQVAAVCDVNPGALRWYERLDPCPNLVSDYREILEDDTIEAIYCAVPHHRHQEIYRAVVSYGKHLLGEKPFGIDLDANRAIIEAVNAAPDLVVRCSSEFPFYPGGQQAARWIEEERFGRVLEVRSSFLHSSDIDPLKPINWKRQAQFNGEYGCMGDLGMHALHIPLRAGWAPRDVRAVLSNVFTTRPDHTGNQVDCDTWDNAVLCCEVEAADYTFPLRLEIKRIAPGEMNTWTIEVDGTEGSLAFTTKYPKTLRVLEYKPGDSVQAWRTIELGSQSAYPTITGGIFEFGFSDSVLQMCAAFLDEIVHGRSNMRQPFHCATPEETALSHQLMTAALRSNEKRQVVELADMVEPPPRQAEDPVSQR